MLPEDDNVKLMCWRNRLAVTLTNWIMWHIATPGYRRRLDVFIRTGMESVYGRDAIRLVREDEQP